MNIGASTANLYPMLTEDSLDQLLEAGFRHIEVFINSVSETEHDFVKELRRRADASGARIVALHPYTSGYEPYLLFSDYQRRFEDGLKQYAHIFEAAAELGASYVVMHGDRLEGVLSAEASARRYERLYDLGQTMGVTLLQENVVRFRASSIDYIKAMRRILGEKAQFVFDSKQCARCGLDPADVIAAMGEGLKHVHISDRNEQKDCLIPGSGNVDFKNLLRTMQAYGFNGDWILELYRVNFFDISGLINGSNFLKKVLDLYINT